MLGRSIERGNLKNLRNGKDTYSAVKNIGAYGLADI
jgi:hypothetical protein